MMFFKSWLKYDQENITTVNTQPTKVMKFANIHISFENFTNASQMTGLVDPLKLSTNVWCNITEW